MPPANSPPYLQWKLPRLFLSVQAADLLNMHAVSAAISIATCGGNKAISRTFCVEA